MTKIFLVEDDDDLKLNIEEILRANDYEVIKTENFKNVANDFKNSEADLILMDINLPYFDGNFNCKMIRKFSNTPLIFISARNSETDQVFGLELGADDYLVKPFSMNILLAKINALLRRGKKEADKLNYKELVLDCNTFCLLYKDNFVELSKSEYRLLRFLMRNPLTFVKREDLLEEIWDDKAFIDDNTLSVNISRLKNKLNELKAPFSIKTKRGIGYQLSEGNEE